MGMKSVDEGYDSEDSEDKRTAHPASEEEEEVILETLTIQPAPESGVYTMLGLPDYCSAKHGDAASSSRMLPLVWIRRWSASGSLSRLEAEVSWASGNELRISKTLLPEDTQFEVSSSQDKLQLFVQLDPGVEELKSFMADVKFETDDLMTQRKFLGPIVIFLKEELAESQEAKVLALVTAEERAAAHNLVQKKELSQLTEGVGPHQDTALAILCAQKQPPQPGRILAQIHAVLRRLSSSPDPAVRAAITRTNNNELSALDIAAIMNNAVVACYIVEVVYNMTDSLDTALDTINSRDSQGNTILHLLARKGDTNIATLRALLGLQLRDGSRLVRMVANLKTQYPVHIAAQSKVCQPATLRLLHHNMANCFEVADHDGMTALHYACQRCDDSATVSTILSCNKENINLVSRDGLTALDLVSRRGEATMFSVCPQQKLEMIQLLLKNGGKSGAEMAHLEPETRIQIRVEDCTGSVFLDSSASSLASSSVSSSACSSESSFE